MMRSYLQLALSAATLSLVACGGGGTDNAAAPANSPPVTASTYTIGGTVSGLAGTGLVLQNNGGNNLTVATSGAFVFGTAAVSGATYNIAVLTQPSNPAQTCAVRNSSGTIASSNISAVTVTCVNSATGTGDGDQYGSGPDPSPDATGRIGSSKLIEDARVLGAITTEQALLYAVYADFNDPRLPLQYRGDDAGVIEGDALNRAVAYIATVGEANVSAATLDALRPFFIPPYYAGSYWRKLAASQTLAASETTSLKTEPTKSGWNNFEGTNVVVWYRTGNEGSDLAKAIMLVGEFDNTIWPKLTALMGRTPKSDLGSGGFVDGGIAWSETDGRLDIFLDDLGGKEGRTNTLGWSRCKDVPVRIFLDRGLSNQGLISQGAHEFMHALQYSYDVKAKCVNDYRTIKEATATWATHFVYPKSGWETKYAKYYLDNGQVSVPYDSAGVQEEFRYGAYLLPLFLETRFGTVVVKNIWDKTVAFNSELFAIDGALHVSSSKFETEWPKFVAAIWNRDSIGILKTFGVTATPSLEDNAVLTLSNGFGASKHAVKLPHASMAFYRVVLSNAAARSITLVNGLTYVHRAADEGLGTVLYFAGMNALNRNGASMQVYLKVNGAWQSEPVDFSNIPWDSVCRDDPAGKIEEAVFMYGNAEINESSPNYTTLTPVLQEPGLVATDIGCRDWTGSVSMSKGFDTGSGSETLTISNITLKNTMPTAAPKPGPGPAYMLAANEEVPAGFGFTYATTGGTATWTYNNYLAPPVNCTYTGRETFSVAGPTPEHFFTNWTPPGSAARGVVLSGMLTNALATVILLPADWRCVDPDGKVTTGTDIEGTSLDIHVTTEDQAVRIGSGGLSVSGTGKQSGEPNATGSWSFTGAVN